MSERRESIAALDAAMTVLELRVKKVEESAERPSTFKAGIKSPVVIAALVGAFGTLIGGLAGMYFERERLQTNAILQATSSQSNDDKVNNLCVLVTMGMFSSERTKMANEIVRKRTGANCP